MSPPAPLYRLLGTLTLIAAAPALGGIAADISGGIAADIFGGTAADIFSDGFESADTAAWSQTVPPFAGPCASGLSLAGELEGDLGPAPGGAFTEIACLEIRNDRNVARGPELAVSGIPMAQATNLTSTADLAVVGPGNRRIAAQFDVLSRWASTLDDPAAPPIRWLQVTVPARVAADGVTTYSLRRYGTLPAPADAFAVAVTPTAGGAVVDTGLASFVLDGANPALFAQIDADPDNDPLAGPRTTVYSHSAGAGPRLVFDPGTGPITLETPDDAVVDAGGFEIVESGPVKAVVVLRGHFRENPNTVVSESRCDTDPGGGIITYERFGYTVIATLVRGSRDVRLQVQIRNECSSAIGEPWTDEQIDVHEASWVFPFTTLTPATTYYGGGLPLASTAGSAQVVAEQRLGANPGSGWVRRAEVRVAGSLVEMAATFDRPIVAVADTTVTNLLVGVQMPWMRFREPQAVAVSGSTLSLEFISRPITVGEGKGIWNFATLNLLPTALLQPGAPTPAIAALEALRERNRFEMERGLLVRAPRDYVNTTGLFPSLGTDAPSTLKTNYLAWMNMLHDETIAPGGGYDQGKIFGSQIWPESGAADTFGHEADDPDGWSPANSWWDPPGNEVLEFLRSGDPRWIWDFSVPAYWTQTFTAYMNIGRQTHGNRNGVAIQSGGAGCVAFPCTATGSGGGHWHRSGFGSDDYTYVQSLEVAYAVRPSPALRDRFAQAGANLIARYGIPRVNQTSRDPSTNQVDITRQVIQHYETLANCAEFVPGAQGQACHDKLIEVYDELALDNLNANLMCQRQENAPPPATDCFVPQQFMVNALMYQWFHRIWSNYGEPPSSTSTVRDALVCGPVAHYEWAVPKLGNGVSIDPTFGASCNPGTGDGCWWSVLDCTLSGDQSSILSCTAGEDSDQSFVMGSQNRPHTLYPLFAAQEIDPQIGMCNIVKAAFDAPSFAGTPDDPQGGWAGVGHFLPNSGVPMGWWKGTGQMLQGMVFAVGIYDTCADPPSPVSPCP